MDFTLKCVGIEEDVGTYAVLIKAWCPAYKKALLTTCRMKVRYCRGRTGQVKHTQKRKHCTEFRERARGRELRSASRFPSPEKQMEDDDG